MNNQILKNYLENPSKLLILDFLNKNEEESKDIFITQKESFNNIKLEAILDSDKYVNQPEIEVIIIFHNQGRRIAEILT